MCIKKVQSIKDKEPNPIFIAINYSHIYMNILPLCDKKIVEFFRFSDLYK